MDTSDTVNSATELRTDEQVLPKPGLLINRPLHRKHRFFNLVGNSVQRDQAIAEHGESRARIPIARLANGAGVAEGLAFESGQVLHMAVTGEVEALIPRQIVDGNFVEVAIQRVPPTTMHETHVTLVVSWLHGVERRHVVGLHLLTLMQDELGHGLRAFTGGALHEVIVVIAKQLNGRARRQRL